MKATVLCFLVLVGLMAVSDAMTVTKLCTSDADCSGGCCTHAKDGSGMICQRLAKLYEVCDLEGQGMGVGVCPCDTGFTCEKIDLGEYGKDAAVVNPILEKHHYGWCM